MNTILTCSCKLADVLRSVVPVPGIDFDRMVLVNLKPGESVSAHQHSHHTALYYPADSAPLLVTPIAGMIIYLPPGTPHEVSKVNDDRLSVAMIVEPVV